MNFSLLTLNSSLKNVSYLRDYQTAIKARIADEWQRCRSVMVQMPTGTGKTRLLASVVNDELNTDDETKGRTRSVWIVAHRRELVEQIKETVEQFIINNAQFIINNAQSYYDGRIKVMSIQWLARHWEDVRDERPGLIVIDEAHHALADSYTELWRRYPEAKKLGMTATPCRMNGKGFTDLFDVLVMSDSIAEFIRLGWLSAFDYVSIRRESEEQRLINELKKRGSDGDFQVKEMNEKLNRLTSIERLYDAMRRYADGKKGIVYAISIEHAKNIAEYYSRRGVKAVAIDSRTPQAARKAMVSDFKAGRIKVMVNVDVFSEGFDCPDVEFVQMGRPTLSLAKYLQQAGRGLRKSKGKAACMMIDNVGLYRVFGLPTRMHDWQAMFEGRTAGKAEPRKRERRMAATAVKEDTGCMGNEEMEMVVSHERLLTYIERTAGRGTATDERLTAYRDRKSGLWGLRRGRTVTAEAQYVRVFDIKGDMAAVRFGDMRVGTVDGNGTVRMRIDRYEGMRFRKDDFIEVRTNGGKTFYIDMRTDRLYREKPEVTRYGNIEVLKMGRTIYSRTKEMYVNRQGIGRGEMVWRGFYLEIADCNAPEECRKAAMALGTGHEATACIIEGCEERAYWCCGRLADGSAVAGDGRGGFYRLAANRKPEQIDMKGCMERRMAQLKAEACGKAAEAQRKREKEEHGRWLKRLESMRGVRPFKSGTKWGLKTGDRIVVPPKYRMIMPPVGRLCAYEDCPEQWGVMAIDGKVVAEARYMGVEIDGDGTVRLTVIPGKVITRTEGQLTKR